MYKAESADGRKKKMPVAEIFFAQRCYKTCFDMREAASAAPRLTKLGSITSPSLPRATKLLQRTMIAKEIAFTVGAHEGVKCGLESGRKEVATGAP